jgi:hypothetical protein
VVFCMDTTKKKIGNDIVKTFCTKFKLRMKILTMTPSVFQATGDPYSTVLYLRIGCRIEIHWPALGTNFPMLFKIYPMLSIFFCNIGFFALSGFPEFGNIGWY